MSNNKEFDYEELGFKCGIEIHQQLDTKTKLFCDCPVELEDEEKDQQFQRYLRAVSGEAGEKDEAAEFETSKSKKFLYNYYERNNCLVEIDEEPPKDMDEEALETALTFSQMVNADVPDEIQVMRKIVVDGSNTTGFQRTTMVALNGQIETSQGTVSIEDIELEEESSGIHKRTDEYDIYDLNRLGIPLIEIGTDASIQSPEHAKETAKKLGMLLRSTMNVRRGIGTIRQDVNISIEKGARVEIKGFQDISNLDQLVRNEVQRQKRLVEIGENTEKDREIQYQKITGEIDGTENEIVSTVLENSGEVYAILLPNLTGKMKQDISGEKYLAKEFVDYAKTHGVQGILHTDEDIERYNLEDEFAKAANILDKRDQDVVAIIADQPGKASKATETVVKRAKTLYNAEIPDETRQAQQNFTTKYLRPLPGSARMYPETDVPPIQIKEEEIEEIRQDLPETIEEKEQRYSEEIGEQLAEQITHSKELQKYEELKTELEDHKTLANTLANTLPKLESDNLNTAMLSASDIRKVLQDYESGEIGKGDIEKIFANFIKEDKPIGSVIEGYMDQKTDESEIRETVKQVIEDNQEMIENQGERAQGALMGMVMSQVNAEGGQVSQILQEELQKEL